MNPAKLNYIVDAVMAIVFGVVAITGILKLPVLHSIYRTLPTKIMTQMHDISGVLLVILVAIHLILHWNWIVCMTKSFFKKEKETCEVKTE